MLAGDATSVARFVEVPLDCWSFGSPETDWTSFVASFVSEWRLACCRSDESRVTCSCLEALLPFLCLKTGKIRIKWSETVICCTVIFIDWQRRCCQKPSACLYFLLYTHKLLDSKTTVALHPSSNCRFLWLLGHLCRCSSSLKCCWLESMHINATERRNPRLIYLAFFFLQKKKKSVFKSLSVWCRFPSFSLSLSGNK